METSLNVVNLIAEEVISAAIEVHRHLGPGLMESAYEEILGHEFELRSLPYVRNQELPVVYKDVLLECGYHIDFIVADQVVVEVKAVERVVSIHEAQLLTYLKLGGWKLGLLINFNETSLKQGIRRKTLNTWRDSE